MTPPPVGPQVCMRYPEWSPRGDVVVFERGDLRGNTWTLALDRPQRDRQRWRNTLSAWRIDVPCGALRG